MSKYDELKRLAEASTQGVWRAGNAYSKAFVPAYQIVVETDEGPYVIMEGNQNFLPDAVANIAYVAAASPAAILELIAENERLRNAMADLLDWVAPIAGDNQDDEASKRELDSVRVAEAAMQEASK